MTPIVNYLSPLSRLGLKRYSYKFPLFATLGAAIALEAYAKILLHSPDEMGALAIIIFLFLILYFSFRDGIVGGLTATLITTLYYCYIIFDRNYSGAELTQGLEATIILSALYVLMATIIGWLKQTIDNLIKREAEQKHKLEAILEQLPVGIIVTDSKGKIEIHNQRTASILGMDIPSDFVVGKQTLRPTIRNGKVVPGSQSMLVQVLATGKPIVNREYAVVRGDGKLIYIQGSAAAIHNEKNQVIAAASIINDITNLKEAEKRKDDFVNMASHELKTPVTSMKLYIDLLLEQVSNLDDQKKEIVTSLQLQSVRLQFARCIPSPNRQAIF